MSEEKKLIDTKVGLQYCMGKPDFYRQVMELFASGAKEDRIKETFEAKEWENYRVEVHAVKGTAMTIGAVSLSEKAKAIDLDIKAGKTPISRESHEAFLEEYLEVLRLIREDKVL